MGTVRLNADIDEKMAMELFHTLVDEKLTFSAWLRRQIAIYLSGKRGGTRESQDKNLGASSDPHEMFNEAVKAGRGNPMEAFKNEAEARNVLGILWNSGETAPDETCALLGIRSGSTYGKCVRPFMSMVDVEVRSKKPGGRRFQK